MGEDSFEFDVASVEFPVAEPAGSFGVGAHAAGTVVASDRVAGSVLKPGFHRMHGQVGGTSADHHLGASTTGVSLPVELATCDAAERVAELVFGA